MILDCSIRDIENQCNLNQDLNSSKTESLEIIRFIPFTGLNRSSFGCIGFVETFHPTCRIFTSSVTANPKIKNGATILSICIFTGEKKDITA